MDSSKVLHHVLDPAGQVGPGGAQRHPLQRQARCEQPLHHVVVQVAGDAVAIGQDAPARAAGPAPRRSLPGPADPGAQPVPDKIDHGGLDMSRNRHLVFAAHWGTNSTPHAGRCTCSSSIQLGLFVFRDGPNWVDQLPNVLSGSAGAPQPHPG